MPGGSKAVSVAEMERRIKALGERARQTEQARIDTTVRVRRLDPARLRPLTPVRCRRCGGTIDGEPAQTSTGPMHKACKPQPAPPVNVNVVTPLASRQNRTSHLTATDRARVLAWLAQHGPATARMAAWAVGVDHREVQLLLRALEGRRVEAVGNMRTDRRGTPPTVWRTREAVAA